MTSEWRAERNGRALARLRKSLPALFPQAVLRHALARPFIPPTPRLAVDSYWREHPIRADRLARSLARRSGAPEGWTWRLPERGGDASVSFRLPPAPYRDAAFARGSGHCCVCGQPVFRFGWHQDLWQDGRPNGNAAWHNACVVAWKLWTAPRSSLKPLRRLQGRLCPLTGTRLLRTGEVDHRVPLYQVWRDHRDTPWPALLAFWGTPNLQVINKGGHLSKSGVEARDRAERRRLGAATASDQGRWTPAASEG